MSADTNRLRQYGCAIVGECFVVRHNQHGPLHRLGDIGHCEDFARSGHAHQHLLAQSGDQSYDGLRLVSGGLTKIVNGDNIPSPPSQPTQAALPDLQFQLARHYALPAAIHDLDLHSTTIATVARSLGRQGLRVHLGWCDPHSLTVRSRYTADLGGAISHLLEVKS